MSTKRKLGLTSLIIILIAIIWFVSQWIFHKPSSRNQAAATVTTTAVVKKPMPISVTLPGQVEAVNSVSIRSQVTGLLQDIAFTPGQIVQKGDLLFQINPDSFNVTLSQAKATLARDQAQYEESQKDEKRLAALVKNKFVSEQQYSQMRSQVAMQKATVLLDQEKIKEAELQLSYTKITSPVTGKSGNVVVKVGDLITAEGTDPLVLINEMMPVYVITHLPQRDLPLLLQYRKENAITAEIWDENQTKQLGNGDIVFIDNAVDPQSGTVLLKALIPNKTLMLWPAQLVMIKIIFTMQPNVLVVPSQSVFSDDKGQYVYLLKDNRAVLQYVVVDRQEGAQTVIKKGVNAGDQVITELPPNMQNNAQVQVAKSAMDSQE